MSNKFLPFITENSTPIHIYRVLLSRSKGISTHLVLSIFHIVLLNKISNIRKFVKTLSDLDLVNMYREICLHYNYETIINRITLEEIELFLSFQNYLPKDVSKYWDNDLNEFDEPDILLFFLVVSKNKKFRQCTELPFQKIHTDITSVLSNLKNYNLFLDEALPYEFVSLSDLKAYILYHICLSEKDLPAPVCAKLKFNEKENKNDSPL